MKSVVLLSALLLSLGLSPPAVAATPAPSKSIAAASELDHILLWGRDIDQVSAIMGVKLGFQVRPGRNPGGVANRFVRMADRSYIELLGITRKDAVLDPGMDADQASLHGGAGARMFGLRSSTLDDVRVALKSEGFATTDMFSASPDDPDGQGPSMPPRWRLFAFEKQPLSSGLFFIDYAPESSTPAHVADDRAMREHPNGARAVTAMWLLSADADANRKQFERMGLAGAVSVRIAQVSARGYCVPVGGKRMLVLQPDGAGIAADALRGGGPQVLGVSIGVADFDKAKRRVERGYEKELASYRGPMGESFLAPTQDDLGLLMEFHAMPKAGSANACAAQ